VSRLLERDLAIKLLSVFIALILWLAATNERNPQTTTLVTAVPVTLQEPDQDCTVIRSDPKTVDVRVRGSRSVIENLNRSDVVAHVDLKDVGVGERSLPVEVDAPSGLQVLDIRPARISVEIDLLKQQQVPVTVRLEGEVPQEYERDEPTCRPTDVLVDGPRSQLEQVAGAEAVVDISGATDDVVRAVSVRLLDEEGEEVRGLGVQPTLVEVLVPVTPLPPSRMVAVQPATVGEPPPGYRLTSVRVVPSRVKVRGPQAVIDALETLGTEEIDLAGARETVSRQVKVLLPEGCASVEPAQVSVTATVEPRLATREVGGVPVKVTGLADGVEAEVLTPRVTVLVSGPASAVAELEAQDLTVTVSATGLSPGTHALPCQVQGPAGLALETSPAAVAVRVGSG